MYDIQKDFSTKFNGWLFMFFLLTLREVSSLINPSLLLCTLLSVLRCWIFLTVLLQLSGFLFATSALSPRPLWGRGTQGTVLGFLISEHCSKVVLFICVVSNIIYSLKAPKSMSPALISPPTARIITLPAYPTSPIGSLDGISNLPCSETTPTQFCPLQVKTAPPSTPLLLLKSPKSILNIFISFKPVCPSSSF